MCSHEHTHTHSHRHARTLSIHSFSVTAVDVDEATRSFVRRGVAAGEIDAKLDNNFYIFELEKRVKERLAVFRLARRRHFECDDCNSVTAAVAEHCAGESPAERAAFCEDAEAAPDRIGATAAAAAGGKPQHTPF